MANVYFSNENPRSAILKSSFTSRLASLYGYRPTDRDGAKTDFGKRYGLDFVRVDLNNPNYRVKSAAIGSFFESNKLSKTLEKYFEEWETLNALSYSDIAERQQRLNELTFMACNEPTIERVCRLVADEATQIDQQNRILSVESPNLSFSQKCYDLFGIWGITPNRINAICYDLELYGEGFWGHKLTMSGVQSIRPVIVDQIKERLEFSPSRMATYLAQRDGYMQTHKDRRTKLNKLLDSLLSEDVLDLDENASDFFDSKLLGYELEDGNILPPWLITHFRFNEDHSEFYPYGRPPLLHCLAPFKQLYSTIALQGLARSMSFPVTLYKVKVNEGTSPGKAFELVDEVRQEYDNLGVTAATAGNEVYTVNTKIWIADGLLDIDVKESKSDIDFVGDLEMFQDRMMIACGVPKGYMDQEFGGFGNSGISLVEQYKPFARHVYAIQTAFLQGLGELIRLHMSITNEYDYNTPFILSMRFPAVEMGEEQREARSASIELCQSVIELLSATLGIEEGSPLPEDVVVDILSKYSFLDATDIQKWMRLSALLKPANIEASEEAGEGDAGFGDDMDGGGGDVDLGADAGIDDGQGEGDDMGEGEEIIESFQNKKQRLRERALYLQRLQEKELKRIQEAYFHITEKDGQQYSLKEQIYMKFVESNNLQDFTRRDSLSVKGVAGKHCLYIPKIKENSHLYKSIQILQDNTDMQAGMKKLREQSVEEKMNEYKEDFEQPNHIKQTLKLNGYFGS